MKKSKLANKISLIILVMLIVVFALMIVSSVFSTQKALNTSISAELNAISQMNANKVQQALDEVEQTTNSMTNYLLDAYQRSAENKAAAAPAEQPAPAETQPEGEQEPAEAPGENEQPQAEQPEGEIEQAPSAQPAESEFISTIFNVPITRLSYEVEQFMTETARSSVTSTDSLFSMGAYFEPYAYDDNIEDYSFVAQHTNTEGQLEWGGVYSDYSQKAFYKDAMAAKAPIFTKPEIYNGAHVVSVSYPIIFNGDPKGVVVSDIKLESFSDVKIESRYKTLYSTILDSNGIILYDTDSDENIGKDSADFFSKPEEHDEVIQHMSEGQPFTIETTREDGTKYTRFYNPISVADGSNWWALTAIATKDMNDAVTQTTIILLIIVVFSLIVVSLVIAAILKKSLRPISDVVAAAEQISHGSLDIHLDHHSNDEIGDLTRAFGITVNGLRAIIEDENHLLKEMANGNFDLKSSAREYYIGDFAPVLEAIREINSKLSRTLSQIESSANQVSSGADQVSSSSQALAQGATEQASSVQELSATINEISAQIRENAENAQQASALVDEVGQGMMQSNEKMQEMIQAMGDISSSSSEIGKIIKTIEDIAFQTNILALNAAVEAARAGAAGKGFAVVADEVRNLASKSAEASKNTAALIETSIHAVENGTRIADETAKSLLDAVAGAKEATVTVNKISEASSQQAASIAQITLGIDQISSVVQTNSATSEECAAASEELSSQAQVLNDLVHGFTLRKEDTVSYASPVSQATDSAADEELVFSYDNSKY